MDWTSSESTPFQFRFGSDAPVRTSCPCLPVRVAACVSVGGVGRSVGWPVDRSVGRSGARWNLPGPHRVAELIAGVWVRRHADTAETQTSNAEESESTELRPAEEVMPSALSDTTTASDAAAPHETIRFADGQRTLLKVVPLTSHIDHSTDAAFASAVRQSDLVPGVYEGTRAHRMPASAVTGGARSMSTAASSRTTRE